VKILLSLFLILNVIGNGSKSHWTKSSQGIFEIITFEDFEKMMEKPSTKIRIFNFWATWCAPCVKEMPYFERVQAEDSSLELIFISMDDGRKPERVTNFIERKGIKAPVYLLNDVDYNKWIDKVDPSWSGAIPATLFIKPDGSKYFHEGEVDENELKSIIQKLK
jgi:thiol-disulfide isomerase/thioredoxin